MFASPLLNDKEVLLKLFRKSNIGFRGRKFDLLGKAFVLEKMNFDSQPKLSLRDKKNFQIMPVAVGERWEIWPKPVLSWPVESCFEVTRGRPRRGALKSVQRRWCRMRVEVGFGPGHAGLAWSSRISCYIGSDC